MNKIPKYVIILSLDAVGTIDLPYLKSLPNMKRYFEGAGYCDAVQSVYPSLTYPCHASIVTGKWPKNHGVVNNTFLQPERRQPDWRWYRHCISGTTLYDEAKRSGRSVAAFLWPVTAKSDTIDYHVPEIFSNRRWDNQIFTSLRNGSKGFQLRLMLKYGWRLRGTAQPALDEFTFSCTLDTIRRKKPHLVMTHLTDVDTVKHYAVDREEVRRALARHDERLGRLVRTLKKLGIYDETTIVLLGDHSQMPCHHIIYLNTFFRARGWLKYSRRKRSITDWSVIAWDCDGSAYVYIRPELRERMGSTVMAFLARIQATNRYGIARIYTAEEASALGADPDCFCMVEAKRGYYFQNGAHRRKERLDWRHNAKHRMLATHGYLPTLKGYGTFFAMRGPGVRPGAYTGEMNLTDEGPTLAALTGLSLPAADGRIIKELLARYEKN
ncbi:MAG: alkaline phosphatase family protein [Eubacteriales bacterium]|nr:alkaline phosphatase family protein [Eubacteriales bacterium]